MWEVALAMHGTRHAAVAWQTEVQNATMIKNVPWAPLGGDADQRSGDAPLGPMVPAAAVPPVPAQPMPFVEQRRVYKRRHVELASYGYTPCCVGCAAARAGETQWRSEARRVRIEQAMRADAEPEQCVAREENSRAVVGQIDSRRAIAAQPRLGMPADPPSSGPPGALVARGAATSTARPPLLRPARRDQARWTPTH